MPIYAFECDACQHHFERLQKLSDADPTVCPDCGAEQVRRQLTAPQFRLSGGGWYETDFKKDGDRKRNLAGEGSSGGAAATSADAKPADKGADKKPAESKSTDSKPAESKPTESKPASPSKTESKPAA